MDDQIEAVLEEVRPALARHKGGVELDRFDPETGIVYVRLKGSCRNCPLSTMTLKWGIEALLCERLSEVSGVEEIKE